MRPPDAAPAAADVLTDLLRHPIDRLWRRWNWKSAILSALMRASIFFAANLTSGVRAAVGAFAAELIFRAATSGFYGAITEAFVPVRPAWTGTLVTALLLPAISHALEFALHAARGTPELWRSVALSAIFTVISTAFNLFAMRRGALIVGPGRASVLEDLRRMPVLIAAFIMRACKPL